MGLGGYRIAGAEHPGALNRDIETKALGQTSASLGRLRPSRLIRFACSREAYYLPLFYSQRVDCRRCASAAMLTVLARWRASASARRANVLDRRPTGHRTGRSARQSESFRTDYLLWESSLFQNDVTRNGPLAGISGARDTPTGCICGTPRRATRRPAGRLGRGRVLSQRVAFYRGHNIRPGMPIAVTATINAPVPVSIAGQPSRSRPRPQPDAHPSSRLATSKTTPAVSKHSARAASVLARAAATPGSKPAMVRGATVELGASCSRDPFGKSPRLAAPVG